MLIFAMGFTLGMKFLKNPTSNTAKNQVENNVPIQGNKDDSTDENVDKPQGQSNENGEENPEKENSNTVVTTPNKPTENVKPSDAALDKKEVFLTFDDGPSSKVTPRILEILDDYNIKATFFVIGKNAEHYPELIKRIHDSGHLIANHTYSHDYKFIYSSTSNFLVDLEKSTKVLASILGSFDNKIIRFPGGSFGRTAYKEAVTKAGYTYVDWNALNNDAGDPKRSTIPSAELVQNLKNSVNNMNPKNKNHVVVLMHDTGSKSTTADSLPEIIEFLKAQGYEFKTLAE